MFAHVASIVVFGLCVVFPAPTNGDAAAAVAALAASVTSPTQPWVGTWTWTGIAFDDQVLVDQSLLKCIPGHRFASNIYHQLLQGVGGAYTQVNYQPSVGVNNNVAFKLDGATRSSSFVVPLTVGPLTLSQTILESYTYTNSNGVLTANYTFSTLSGCSSYKEVSYTYTVLFGGQLLVKVATITVNGQPAQSIRIFSRVQNFSGAITSIAATPLN